MNDFSTQDIVLAAFLKAKGVQLTGITKNGNRGTFIFGQVDLTVIDDYDLGRALVEPRALNHEIKTLTTAARR